MSQSRIHAVVLAAGRSTRFGGTKQLAKLHGEPLARRAVATAEQVTGASTLLVIGHDRQAVLESCLPMQGFFLCNERYADGMASSIAVAAAALDGVSDAMLLLLADQPLVAADQLAALKQTWMRRPRAIVASRYAGVLGPPVVFPAATFDRLRALKGDRGARELIDSGAEQVIAVDCEAAAVDIDTPEALQDIS